MEKRFYFITLVIIAILFPLSFVVFNPEDSSWEGFFNYLLWSMQYTLLLGFGNGYLSDRLNKKFSWMKQLKMRIFTGVIVTIVYSFFVAVFIAWIMLVLRRGLPFEILWGDRSISGYIEIIKWSLIISLVFHLRGFILAFKEQIKKNEALKIAKLESEVLALQKQMDAHFLFNSLSVLKELIYTDKELANEYLDRFADVYRYITQNNEKNLVKLEDELEFAEKYLFMQETRFEEALDIQIERKAIEMSQEILPLSIQIGIENALRHNTFSMKYPLKIRIYFYENNIVIENNIQQRSDSSGTGIGLKNLKKRSEIITKRPIKIIQENGIFALQIPLLP